MTEFNSFKKIPQSGNMQHPICGKETNDYFFGVESSIAGVFITSEGGHILKPSLSPLFPLLQTVITLTIIMMKLCTLMKIRGQNLDPPAPPS